MLGKVLGIAAFGRTPKRAAKVLLLSICLAGVGMLATSAFAAGANPAMQLVQTQDANGDGHLDGLLVTFDSPMDATLASPNGFYVDGYTVDQPHVGWTDANATTHAATKLLVALKPLTSLGDTAAIPFVRYGTNATVKARAWSPNAPGTGAEVLNNANKQATDTAGPVLMRVQAKDFGSPGAFNAEKDELRFTFSEPVTVAGATPATRVASLDTSLVFSPIKNCPMNPADANAQNMAPPNSKSNFPSVGSGSIDPIVEPSAPVQGKAQYSSVIKVRMLAGLSNSPITDMTVPGFCGVGIDPQGTSSITDQAPTPNNAVAQNFGGGNYRRDIEVAPTVLSVDADGIANVFTQDFAPPAADGYVHAIKVQFDQPLVESTISNALASKFTVKSGGIIATVTGVDTGAAQNDDSLVVHFTTPTPWSGGDKPTIAFDGSACSLKASVVSPGDYPACADSFTATATKDGVPPAVVGASTVDANKNGYIDGVDVTFTEAINAASIDGWTVGGANPTGASASADKKTLSLTFAETPANTTAASPNVHYNPATGHTTDATGAQVASQTFPAADNASPRLLSATALSSGSNGTVDRIALTFSEPVLDSAIAVSKLSVGGEAADDIDSGTANDNVVSVVTNKTGTGSYGVAYDGGSLADLHANNNTDGFALNADAVADGAKPVVTSLTTDPSGSFSAGVVNVHASISELADGNVAPTVQIGGKDVSPVSDLNHNAAGFQTADLSKWDGTITIASDACDKQNGCAASVTLTGLKDPAGNSGIDATPVGVAIDTVAPAAATAESSAAQQQSGYPAIDANKIGSHTNNLAVSAAITAGQLSSLGQTAGGTAELLVDHQPLDPAAKIGGIDDSATTVSIATAFADAAALQSAITEGTHTFTVKTCDASANCTESGGVSVASDYTAPTVALSSPNTGSFAGGDKVCIQWAAVGDDVASTELRYSLDGGSTFGNVIATGLPKDPTEPCGDVAAGNGYLWTIPSIPQTTTLKVQVRSIDTSANDATAASADNLKVTTITQTVLSIATTPANGSIVSGQAATIAGKLTGNGYAVAGKQVQIQRRNVGQSAFTTIATVVTNSNGDYSYTTKPVSNATYRTSFNAADPYKASTSALKAINVAVNMPASQSASTLKRGQAVTIRGSVQPGKAGKKVQLQALQSGKWQTVSTQTLPSNSTFAFSYKSTTAKKLLFRVVYTTQDQLNAWNISKSFMVTWK